MSMTADPAELTPRYRPRRAGWLARLFRRDRVMTSLPPLGVTIGDQNLALADLTRNGLCVQGYRGPLHIQDRFDFTLHGAEGRHGAGQAIVVWRKGDRLGAAFYALDAQARTLLAGCADPK